MKRLLFLFIMITTILITSAQEAIVGSYQDSNGNHNVAVRLKDDGRKIDCVFVNLSSTIGNGYIRIDSKKIPEFTAALIEVKSKFKEWSEQARQNNVKSLTKPIRVKFPKVVTYLSDRADFNFSESPQVLFEVKNGVPCVWISTSTSTNFTKYTNKKIVFAMLFRKHSDIQSLISLLGDEDKLLQISCDKIENNKNINNLFQ